MTSSDQKKEELSLSQDGNKLVQSFRSWWSTCEWGIFTFFGNLLQNDILLYSLNFSSHPVSNQKIIRCDHKKELSLSQDGNKLVQSFRSGWSTCKWGIFTFLHEVCEYIKRWQWCAALLSPTLLGPLKFPTSALRCTGAYVYLFLKYGPKPRSKPGNGANAAPARCYLSQLGCLPKNLHLPLTTSAGVEGVPLTLDHDHHVRQSWDKHA